MAGSLSYALQLAQAYTWDQSHGYKMGGMGYPDFDCSGFVGRCLHEAGFNYPSTHVGTLYMDSALLSAGFMKLPFSSSFVPQHGDIFVMNHGSNGHTFFYCKNIRAYTDAGADSDNIGIVQNAKVEASSSRGNTNPGDSRKNGTGAYWEVWSHAYYNLVDRNTYPNDSDTWVYRWPGGTTDQFFPMLAALLLYGWRLKHGC